MVHENIYPTPAECQINNSPTCPHCHVTFKSESNLKLHLIKTHKSCSLPNPAELEKHYYCPNSSCSWNRKKYFKNMKGLRQHFLKMHLPKDKQCPSCNKQFPTDATFSRHIQYCNVWFSCLNCDAQYGSYESLKTHCRRKRHELKPKQEYGEKISKTTQIDQILVTKQQVEQTTVETQTAPANNNNKPAATKSAQNTQTDSIESRESASNTSIDFDDLEFTSQIIEKSTSGTQTPWYEEDFELNFLNCQTQTDLMFDNDLFNTDYYSNMYTQTCEDIFNNMQSTQTLLNDSLRSVESQTMMSSPNIFKDIVHSETQTDAQFRQMLEIINS